MTATPAPPAGAPAGLLALLDRLGLLAVAADPDRVWYSAQSLHDDSGAFCRPHAEFIAACSPSTILALLTAARRGAETMQQQQQDQG